MPQGGYEMQNSQTNSKGGFDEYKNKRDGLVHSVSPMIAITYIALLFGLYGIIYLTDSTLPTALTIEDEEDNPDAFIAERAQQHLKTLTDIGPRITGSYENEVLAVDFFKQEITLIQQQAHPSQKIEVDIQVVSGSYYIDYKPHGAINAYANVQNIVVKLYSRNNSEHSLLVNAHFDSVATSPGGSDDGINCAVMLELLRRLSQSPTPLQNNVIFLFNGAEETPLQASHGFITQHKWAKEVGVVVNLEAAGAGGKEILFQSGPKQPWLLKYYQKVPRPNGQAAGEELFQSGVVPSDTDFRIFRDFGNVVGLDFAFNRDGYRYHTKLDGYANIPAGSYQHIGDNMLSLIQNLANAPELSNLQGQSAENVVYYDFLGLFMICYSETVAVVINILISIFSLGMAGVSFYDFGLGFCRSSYIYLGLTAGLILLGWLAAELVVLIFALIVDGLSSSMSWYKNSWIIFGLYVTPVVICSYGFIVLLNHFTKKSNFCVSTHAQIQAHVLRVIWTIFLLLGTISGFRSVYVILMPILFQTLTFAIIHVTCLQYSLRVRRWQIVYVLGTIIPTVFIMKQAVEIMAVFVPMCGRIGSARNPDIIISFLTCLLTILITSYYAPLVTLLRKPYLLLGSLCGIFVIFFIIVFTPLGFPYSSNPLAPSPQRFWIYHTNRILRNEKNEIYKKDSGYFLLNMDRNSPDSIKKYVKDLSEMTSVAEDCDTILFCGLPIASTRMVAVLHKSTWLSAEQPSIPEPIDLTLNSRINITQSLTRFNFTARGPSHVSLYISPRARATLTNISLIPELPPEAIIWNKRPAYIISYTWGKERAPLTFSVDFETPVNWTGSTFDIALVGKYMNDKINVKSKHFAEFLTEFPNWADVVAWLGTYESWVY